MGKIFRWHSDRRNNNPLGVRVKRGVAIELFRIHPHNNIQFYPNDFLANRCNSFGVLRLD